jgi:hypothetical protein
MSLTPIEQVSSDPIFNAISLSPFVKRLVIASEAKQYSAVTAGSALPRAFGSSQ